MELDEKRDKVNATIQEVACYNMVLTEAIFELLAQKGILTVAEVTNQVRELPSETQLNFVWLQ